MISRLLGALVVLSVIAVVGVAGASPDGPVSDLDFVIAESRGSAPRVAAVADRFVVVWSDPSSDSRKEIRARIYRATDGAAEGPPFVIASAPFDESGPSISAGGQQFLVAWHVRESPPMHGTALHAVRVGLDGRVLDPEPIVIAPAYRGTCENVTEAARIAWNGIDWLAVWHEFDCGSGPTDVRASRINRDGVVLDPDGIPIGRGGVPRIVPLDTDFLVTYSSDDEDGRIAVRLRADGTTRAMATLGNVFDPVDEVASDGRDFLFTWTTFSWSEPSSTWSQLVDGATLEVVEATKRPISNPLSRGPWREHSASAFAGGRFHVVHEEAGTLDPDIFHDEVRLLAGAWAPAIAVVEDKALVTAIRGDQIVGRFFDVNEPTVSATPVPMEPRPTPSPTPMTTFGEEFSLPAHPHATATSDDQVLLVWYEAVGTDPWPRYEVHGQLFHLTRGIVGSPFLISNDGIEPTVASTPERLLERHALGLRVEPGRSRSGGRREARNSGGRRYRR